MERRRPRSGPVTLLVIAGVTALLYSVALALVSRLGGLNGLEAMRGTPGAFAETVDYRADSHLVGKRLDAGVALEAAAENRSSPSPTVRAGAGASGSPASPVVSSPTSGKSSGGKKASSTPGTQPSPSNSGHRGKASPSPSP